MFPASAADMDTKFAFKRRETALQRTDHARGDAGGMPIHPHHRAERLEPERVRQPLEELIAAVVMDDRLADEAPSAAIRSANHGGTRPP